MRLLNNFDFGFDEEAVSPVVGVILMVAITVILAAVIGTFVLDLGGQVQQNAQAGVTFDENEGNNVKVQLNSVQSADHIYVEVSTSGVNESDGSSLTGGVGNGTYDYSQAGGGSNVGANFLLSQASGGGENGGVGTTVTVTTSAYSSGETVSVIGVLEGSENIIQTYDMAS